jgi:hypothetical protein
LGGDAKNSFIIRYVFVKAQLMPDKKENHQAADQPDGEAQDVDQGKNPVSTDDPDRSFQVVS